MRTLHIKLGLIVIALLLVVQVAQAQTQNHVVQPGETLFRIALRYGTSVAAIRAANGLTSDWIYAGQTLVIPGPNAPAATPQPATGEPIIHIVQRGETLFSIGLRYNLQWTTIQAANNIVGTTVYAGQQLIIPTNNAPNPTPTPTESAPPPTPVVETPVPVEATPAPTEPPASTDTVIHVVQQSETLFTIGLRYGLQWTTIQAANGLADTRIYVGQRLVIPTNGSAVLVPAPEPPPLQGPLAGMTGKYFLVDLSEQRLYAFEGEQMARTTLISSGRWPYPTVTGTFSVYLRYKAARMRGPGYDLANVPFTMYFFKGYGLHGTYWHNNFGTPMSHGCVNMPTPEAEWAYYWSDYGTPVIVQQ